MTEYQARAAAAVLAEAGHFCAADEMQHKAEQLRRAHFHEMQKRCQDDPWFADAYEADRMEGF